jgi:hypothetical protein
MDIASAAAFFFLFYRFVDDDDAFILSSLPPQSSLLPVATINMQSTDRRVKRIHSYCDEMLVSD